MIQSDSAGEKYKATLPSPNWHERTRLEHSVGLRAISTPPALYFQIARYVGMLPSWHTSDESRKNRFSSLGKRFFCCDLGKTENEKRK
jgi:hypothetical protein